MTTGETGGEDFVDNLLSDVDDQFQDLERDYNQAREGMDVADAKPGGQSDRLQASNERYALVSQVASLKSEISRQSDELDERDRVLAELGEQIDGFQSDIAERDEALAELQSVRQEVLEERREQTRLQSLLDARGAERNELADVASRLQNERDHVQDLLTTSIARHDEALLEQAKIEDTLRHIEAARDTAAHEHDARAHELIESRAEMSKLIDKLNKSASDAAAADERVEKANALAERRGNEAGYLNRRIDALTEKLEIAAGHEAAAEALRSELALAKRKNSELQSMADARLGEIEAANAAVEAVASRTRDYGELVSKIGELERERHAAWATATGLNDFEDADAQGDTDAPSANASTAFLDTNDLEVTSHQDDELTDSALASDALDTQDRAVEEPEIPAAYEDSDSADEFAAGLTDYSESARPEQDPSELADRARDLGERARELGARRANEAAAAEAAAAEIAATEASAERRAAKQATEEAALANQVAEVVEQPDTAALDELDGDDQDAIDADLAALQTAAWQEAAWESPGLQLPPPQAQAPDLRPDLPPVDSIPRVEYPVPQLQVPDFPPAQAASPMAVADVPEPPLVTIPDISELPPPPAPPQDPIAALVPDATQRRRLVLPANLEPNTPEAVAFLLNQPGAVAIVDARSTCGRTGIRPSELFNKAAALRDHFDIPVEVVVTPVSTPVGGAPELPSIGVHHVTGADTVADRIRALCMGFPMDQPLVVVAGDDHVRRAAISQEANVIEPAAVLNIAG